MEWVIPLLCHVFMLVAALSLPQATEAERLALGIGRTSHLQTEGSSERRMFSSLALRQAAFTACLSFSCHSLRSGQHVLWYLNFS